MWLGNPKAEVACIGASGERLVRYAAVMMGNDHAAGQVIATAMEWYEKGIIDTTTTEGLELNWGNGEAVNQDRLLDLICEAKGWDSQGMPTRQKLDELGL